MVGMSLVVQWFRIHLPILGNMGLIPDLGGSYMLWGGWDLHHNY